MKTLEVIDAIKELSTEGIANVIRDQAEMLILGHSMPREDLEQLAQYMVNEDSVDELYFIIELDSE
jgi:hypothetical protein